MMTRLQRVSSADGTQIAVEATGEGRPVVLIGGAFNDRTTMTGLAGVLAPYYRAVIYDRRGRGDSGDVSADYSVEREMDDLRAVIGHAGGSASLFGHSSGAVLALEAARRGLPVERVAAYETPFIPEGSRPRPAPDVAGRLVTLVRAGDRDEATALFQTEVVGLPAEMVEGMRQSDVWGYLTGLAHSLPYDYALFDTGSPVPAPAGRGDRPGPRHRRVEHLPLARPGHRAGGPGRPRRAVPFARRPGPRRPPPARGPAAGPARVPRLSRRRRAGRAGHA